MNKGSFKFSKTAMLLGLVAVVAMYLVGQIPIPITSLAMAMVVFIIKAIVVLTLVGYIYYGSIAKVYVNLGKVILYAVCGAVVAWVVGYAASSLFMGRLGLTYSINNIISWVLDWVIYTLACALMDKDFGGSVAVKGIKNGEDLRAKLFAAVELQLTAPKYATMCSVDEIVVTRQGDKYSVTATVEDNEVKKTITGTAMQVNGEWIIVDARI